MSRINLNSLIDEVLSMAKDSQSIRKKKRLDDETAQVNQSWDDTPAGQAYWKDIRGRNTALEVLKMHNAGQMDVARENNAGQLARQSLANIGNENVANIHAGASRYGSELGLKGNEITAKATVDAAKATADAAQGKDSGLGKEHIAGLTAIIGDMNAPDEDKAMARQILLGRFRTNKQPATSVQGDQRNIQPPDGILPEKKPSEIIRPATKEIPSSIGRTRTDRPEDYNIFGTKKPGFISEYIDYSGPAPAVKPQKKKISDMSEEEVIAEQNLYNKKYGVNIGGKRFTRPFTPASPMDEWRKAKYGE